MSSSDRFSHATPEELACATTLLHILYWSTVDNQLRPTCEWRTYVETSCRLLAPTAPTLMEAVTQHGSQHFLGEAKESKARRNEANMKLPEPAPRLVAHTPEGHPYLGRLSFGPVERARGLLRVLYQQVDHGGFSHNRSPYSQFLEASTGLMGSAPADECKLGDNLTLHVLHRTAKELSQVSIPPALPKPQGFVPDAKYTELVELTRWMNPDLTR